MSFNQFKKGLVGNCQFSLGIDIKYTVGQRYDGVAANNSHVSGVQAIIRKADPPAIYVYCSAHSLDL